MNTTNYNFIPLQDSKIFELFCLDLFNIQYNYNISFNLNGRNGQKQYGVDIFGYKGDPLYWIGIQCKVRNTRNILTDKEIQKEIKLAESFNPSLSKYIIVTTEHRNSSLQEKIRLINEIQYKKKSFIVEILFWDDIISILGDSKYKTLILKYYSGFIIDPIKNGFASGKYITLILGELGEYSTKYELFVAINPRFNTEKSSIDYYKNRIMVANLHTKSFSLVKTDCSPLDLYSLCSDTWSQFLISKWLKNTNIQEIIYSDEAVYYCSYTKEELNDFLNS